MMEILTVVVCIWLMMKTAKVAFRLTWGLAKAAASILMVLAMPALIICVVFLGGMALIVPVLMIAAAFGIGKACV